jgi:hypothetical protein
MQHNHVDDEPRTDQSLPEHISKAQVHAAWKLLCKPGQQSLSKRDIHAILRSLHPTISASDLDQVMGQMKGRVTLPKLYSILQAAPLPEVLSPTMLLSPSGAAAHHGFFHTLLRTEKPVIVAVAHQMYECLHVLLILRNF